MDKANLIAALLICTFVIDRLVAAVFFIGSYRNAEERPENNRKAARFLLTGILAAAAVVAFDFLRVLQTVWPSKPLLDAVVTWLVIVAAGQQLSSFIGDRGASPKPAAAPAREQALRVSGTLKLDDKSENVLRLQSS